MTEKSNKINLVPPASVAKAAAEGLKLREKFGRGGTIIGITRAHQLVAREKLSPDTIMRMASYFARHEVDKRGKNFFNTEKPSNGYIAWQLWGGDEGRAWAESIKHQLKNNS